MSVLSLTIDAPVIPPASFKMFSFCQRTELAANFVKSRYLLYESYSTKLNVFGLKGNDPDSFLLITFF